MSNIKKLSDKIQKYYETTNTDNIGELVKFMNSNVMHDIYNSLIEMISTKHQFNEDEISLIKWILKACNLIYNDSGESTGLTDSEYDVIVEFYRSLDKGNDVLSEKIITNDDVVYHKYKSLRGTLDKIYKITDDDKIKNKSQKSLDDWVKTSVNKIKDNSGKDIDLWNEEVYVMPKFDGVSCVFEVGKNGELLRALLRGDTSKNETEDVSHIFKNIFKAPITDSEYDYGFKTEVMMTNSNFEKFNKEYNTNYKNTRSVVSSILNSKDVDDEKVKYLTIVPLRVSYYINNEESLQELAPGVFNYPYIKCKLNDVDKIHDFAFSHKTVNPGLRCDGAVIYIINKDIQKYLGRENERQKFEVAFKYTEEVAYSKVKDIEFTSGLYGRMSPVVIFKPVKMKGNMIERASLGSYSRFVDLGLAKGDVIKILYDIIPYVDLDPDDPNCVKSANEKIEPPLICPECGSAYVVNEEGTMYTCPNKKCPCKLRGRILNYCTKIGIENISYATINDFYKLGYLNCIEDLYTLEDKYMSLIQLNGYGKKKIDNIIDSISDHKVVTRSVLMGSIGIEGVSNKTFREVFKYFTIDDLLELSDRNIRDALSICHGIKDKTSEKIIDGINENKNLILFLLNTLTIVNDVETTFEVVMSRTRDQDIMDYVIDHGGRVAENVTKLTDVVIVPEPSSESSKIKKAREMGIPVITLAEAKEYIENHFE